MNSLCFCSLTSKHSEILLGNYCLVFEKNRVREGGGGIISLHPTFDIFPTWRDSVRGRFSWSPHYSSTLWTVVPPFWIPMTMTQTSLVYMAHWLVFRTSGLEQRDSAALFSGSFINTDSSEGTLNNAKIEDIDRKKKQQQQQQQQQQTKTRTKNRPRPIYSVPEMLPLLLPRKTPNLTFWHTINVLVHEETMKIYGLYLIAKLKCWTGKYFPVTENNMFCLLAHANAVKENLPYNSASLFFFLSSFRWFPTGPFCFYRPTRVIPHDPHRIFSFTIFEYKCKQNHTAYKITFLII